MGFIIDGQQEGYSRDLVKPWPFGSPLDNERFQKTFP
jgi:hypothetical protein